MHGRRFLGFELDEAYLALAEQRIHDLNQGVLKIRPVDRPVHRPSSREKVARPPEEWGSKARLSVPLDGEKATDF